MWLLSTFSHLFCVFLVLKQGESYQPSEANLSKAKAILDEHPVFDGHNDLAMGLRDLHRNDLRNFKFNESLLDVEPWSSYPYNHVDLPRIREGRLGAQFWSAYIGCNAKSKDAVQLFFEQIDVIKRLVAKYPDDLAFATNADEVEAALAAKKVASLIGVESGHAINSNIAILRILQELGVRYITLTHGCNTPWADAAQTESGSLPVRNDGLSEFGKKIVKEMNRIGIFVDLSHVSANVMRDALDVTEAPVIFSHSSARAIGSHPRNVPDDVLERMSDNGGVVMVNFYPFFLDDQGNADVQTIVEHINHIRMVAGVDHVGIGSDFGGIEITPEGVDDVRSYPNVFAALMESPDVIWTDEDLAKLANGNIIRAMREMEAVKDVLRNRIPEQDIIPIEDFESEETICMSEIN